MQISRLQPPLIVCNVGRVAGAHLLLILMCTVQNATAFACVHMHATSTLPDLGERSEKFKGTRAHWYFMCVRIILRKCIYTLRFKRF